MTRWLRKWLGRLPGHIFCPKCGGEVGATSYIGGGHTIIDWCQDCDWQSQPWPWQKDNQDDTRPR